VLFCAIDDTETRAADIDCEVEDATKDARVVEAVILRPEAVEAATGAAAFNA